MSRIRSIKPEFWTSEQVMECSTNARLLFIGLWNFCDDAGRLPVKARQIKAQVFPGDDITSENVLGMIDELSANGLITIYVVDNQRYLEVTGWHHQRIDKPQKPKYPPNDENAAPYSANVPRPFPPDRIRSDPIGYDQEDHFHRANARCSRDVMFDRFWEVCPHKVGKKAARKAFDKAIAQCDIETMMAAMRRYVSDKPKDRPFCNPSTWLNEGRWEDQPAEGGTQAPYNPVAKGEAVDKITIRWDGDRNAYTRFRSVVKAKLGAPAFDANFRRLMPVDTQEGTGPKVSAEILDTLQAIAVSCGIEMNLGS